MCIRDRDVTVHCEELAPLPVQYPELGCGFTGLEYSSSNSGVDQNGNYTEIRTWTYTNVCNEQKSDVPVSYTHLRAHETVLDLVCRLLLEKKNKKIQKKKKKAKKKKKNRQQKKTPYTIHLISSRSMNTYRQTNKHTSNEH